LLDRAQPLRSPTMGRRYRFPAFRIFDWQPNALSAPGAKQGGGRVHFTHD